VPDSAVIRYGNEVLTRDEATLRLLTDLLQRLPEALWNTDPTDPTLQQQLFVPIATELARWLEQLTNATKMTLLLEAEGIDLDRLLDDYGLRRYLQRRDPYARQVGMACLFRVKATLTALTRLADLLFDLPHVVLRTGLAEVHVLVADSAPITASTSYWTLTSRDGRRYAVTVKSGLGWISERPPPGLDVTPPGPQWAGVRVQDNLGAYWYLTIQGDTMHADRTPPAWGPASLTPLAVRSDNGVQWGFGVIAGTGGLIPLVLTSGTPPLPVLNPMHPFQTVQVLDQVTTPHWLWIRHGIAHIDLAAPVGATDITPAGGPWRWLRLYGVGDSLWYGYPTSSGVWHVEQTSPGGLGTKAVQELGDQDGTSWRIGVMHSGTFGISNSPRVHLEGLATALLLRDRNGHAWYWRIRVPGPIFEVADTLWPDTVVMMPWGSISWLALPTETGGTVYAYPIVNIGSPMLAAGPPTGTWGWPAPLPLRDVTGQVWDLRAVHGVLRYELDTRSDLPLREPALSLRDIYEAYRHVQAAGTQVTVYVS
jgi:hypothetical protein